MFSHHMVVVVIVTRRRDSTVHSNDRRPWTLTLAGVRACVYTLDAYGVYRTDERVLCRRFVLKGECMFGDECKYYHPVDRERYIEGAMEQVSS